MHGGHAEAVCLEAPPHLSSRPFIEPYVLIQIIATAGVIAKSSHCKRNEVVS
jgi:hypothetical protein